MAYVRVSSVDLDLDVDFVLSSAIAPLHMDILSRVSAGDTSFPVRHAHYTGPEISCPIDAASIGTILTQHQMPEEKTTRHPDAGDLVMVCAPPRHWGEFPASALIDIGIFYDKGGALHLPFGWVDGTVVAKCRHGQLPELRRAGQTLRDLESATLRFGMTR